MYMDASGVAFGADFSVLQYTFKQPIQNGCFSMYYFMNGDAKGSLSVGSTDISGRYKDLWVKSGQHGYKWHLALVPITRETQVVSCMFYISSKSPFLVYKIVNNDESLCFFY